MTDNYQTLANLTQFRYTNRILYNQLVKNHKELDLFLSLSSEEQGLLIQHLYKRSHNALFGYLRYLNLEYSYAHYYLDSEEIVKKIVAKNNYVIKMAEEYNFQEVMPYKIRVIYIGQYTDSQMHEDFFSDKDEIHEFLSINGFKRIYGNKVADQLLKGIDPRQINRKLLSRKAVKEVVRKCQHGIYQCKKLLKRKP